MMLFSQLLIPCLLAFVSAFALGRNTDVFSCLIRGAKNGLRTVCGILPSLIVLLPAVYMLRASGCIDAFTSLLRPLFSRIGIPEACAPLMLLRPVSGSGALSIAAELMNTYGADSLTGRTASVMMGATETTFYVIAVYFGAAGKVKNRNAVSAAVCADIAGFVSAALLCKKLWG